VFLHYRQDAEARQAIKPDAWGAVLMRQSGALWLTLERDSRAGVGWDGGRWITLCLAPLPNRTAAQSMSVSTCCARAPAGWRTQSLSSLPGGTGIG
jgi:hypothetical protein